MAFLRNAPARSRVKLGEAQDFTGVKKSILHIRCFYDDLQITELNSVQYCLSKDRLLVIYAL